MGGPRCCLQGADPGAPRGRRCLHGCQGRFVQVPQRRPVWAPTPLGSRRPASGRAACTRQPRQTRCSGYDSCSSTGRRAHRRAPWFESGPRGEAVGPPAAPRQARGEALATGTRKAASGRGVSSPSRARERQFLSKRMSSLGLKRFCWRTGRCRWRMLENSGGRGRRQGSCWGEVTAPGMVLGTEEWGARGSGLAAHDRDAAGGVVLGGYVATRFPLDSPGQFVRP